MSYNAKELRENHGIKTGREGYVNKEENNKYYGTLIPKMRKLLKSQNKPK